jgi:hypothetical protein
MTSWGPSRSKHRFRPLADEFVRYASGGGRGISTVQNKKTVTFSLPGGAKAALGLRADGIKLVATRSGSEFEHWVKSRSDFSNGVQWLLDARSHHPSESSKRLTTTGFTRRQPAARTSRTVVFDVVVGGRVKSILSGEPVQISLFRRATAKFRVARKNYACRMCGAPVERGEAYCRVNLPGWEGVRASILGFGNPPPGPLCLRCSPLRVVGIHEV